MRRGARHEPVLAEKTRHMQGGFASVRDVTDAVSGEKRALSGKLYLLLWRVDALGAGARPVRAALA
jgi:hypothetical protein